MENLVRLRILLINVFNLFISCNQIQILQYLIYWHEPLNFSEMKIVTRLVTLLLLALVEVVFCPFIP